MWNCGGVQGRDQNSSGPGNTETWEMAVSVLHPAGVLRSYQAAGLTQGWMQKAPTCMLVAYYRSPE